MRRDYKRCYCDDNCKDDTDTLNYATNGNDCAGDKISV